MSGKIVFKGSVDSMSESDMKKAVKFINKCKYCICGTVSAEKGVHLSILTTQEKQEVKEIWYITRTTTRKVFNIRRDNRMEVLYTDNDNQIALYGTAEIVTEPMLKKALWNVWVKLYIPEGPESEEMSLIKFTPQVVEAIVK